MKQRAIVVGGGIVGACCGYALQRRDFDVTLIEQAEPGRAASFGNSGSIGLASVPPLGMPGMLKDLPKMLLNPVHPLILRWRHLPQSLPWLRRFARALSPGRVEAISGARAALLSHAGNAYEGLLAEIGHPELIYASGLIFVFETQAAFEGAKSGVALRRRHGIEAQEMTGPALRELEPAISHKVVAGVHYPVVRTVTDPLTLTQAILTAFQERGGQVANEQVTGFEHGSQGVAAVLTKSGRRPCDLVVIAAGAWSAELARQLGDKMFVVPERGYHIMIARPAQSPAIPLVSGDRNVSIVKMTHGLRMTTMAEFAAIDAPPDHQRALRVFQGAAGVVRDLELDVASSWMGSRPSTPDSLPVIGRSLRSRNVIYAFGHGHLGLTFGAVTGNLVGQLARDETPNFDIAPYRPDRGFDGSHLSAA